jgi:hypothetical protein
LEASDSVSYCFIDEAMILSANAELLKFVIAQAKGANNPVLADDEDYKSALKAVSSSGPGQIDVYVNIKQIIPTVAAKDEAGEPKGILTNLLLDNVTSLALSIDVGSGPGGSTSGQALLKIDGAKKGICKVLEFESGPVEVPPFVSASANSISRVNPNMKKAFDETVRILIVFSPEMAMMLGMGGGLEDTEPMQAPSGVEIEQMPEMPDMEMDMDTPDMPMLAFTVTDTHFTFAGEDAVDACAEHGHL